MIQRTGFTPLEKARLEWARTTTPVKYLCQTDDGPFSLEDQALLERFYRVRDAALGAAVTQELTSAEAGFVLLEAAATLLCNQLSQESFLENARLWHRSMRLNLDSIGVKPKPLGGLS